MHKRKGILEIKDIGFISTRFAGKSLAEVGLRKKDGVTSVAIRRKEQTLSNPYSSIELCANDLIVLLGTPEKMAQVGNLFKTSAEVLEISRT